VAYCKECGTELRAKAKFCPNCGARVSAEVLKVEEPKTKPTKVEVSKVKEIEPTRKLMTDLKFAVVFIVMGFLSRLLLTNVLANQAKGSIEGSKDVAMITSLGNWSLICFVIIGIYIVWFGITDYGISRKRINPHKIIINLKIGIAFVLTGFLTKLLLTNVVAKKITDLMTLTSISNWTLILFVIIGLLIVGFGIADYVIAKKRK
jgi:hypothetical protein